MIVTLKLEPGSTLTEGGLIERVDLGRTPVREAIQRLAWEGLLEIRPRSGVKIAELDPADFPKVLAVREGVEMVLAWGPHPRTARSSFTPAISCQRRPQLPDARPSNTDRRAHV